MKRFAAVLVSVLIIGSAVSAQSADEFIQKASRAYGQKHFAQAAPFTKKPSPPVPTTPAPRTMRPTRRARGEISVFYPRDQGETMDIY